MAPLGRRWRSARRRASQTWTVADSQCYSRLIATPNRRAGTCLQWTEWIASAELIAQLPVDCVPALVRTIVGATQSARRELFGQQTRTDGPFNR